MRNYKATAIEYLRRVVRKNGDELEQALLEEIDEDDGLTYQNAMPVSWIDVVQADRILGKGAQIIYADDSQGLQRLGRDIALDNLTGIYRVLLRVVTIPFAITRAASLWETYHKRGRAHAEKHQDGSSATLIVEGYPDLPAGMLKIVAGYVEGIIELAGSKQYRVEIDDSNPEAWRWRFFWE